MSVVLAVHVTAAREALERLLRGVLDTRDEITAQEYHLPPGSLGEGFHEYETALVERLTAVHQLHVGRLDGIAGAAKKALADLDTVEQAEEVNARDIGRLRS